MLSIKTQSKPCSNKEKFAGPCAQGVLDTLMIPRPMHLLLFLEPFLIVVPGPRIVKVCHSTAPRPLLAGGPLGVASVCFFSWAHCPEVWSVHVRLALQKMLLRNK